MYMCYELKFDLRHNNNNNNNNNYNNNLKKFLLMYLQTASREVICNCLLRWLAYRDKRREGCDNVETHQRPFTVDLSPGLMFSFPVQRRSVLS